MQLRRNPAGIALALAALFAIAAILLLEWTHGPIDRRLAAIALSNTGRWLAAGTSQGISTIQDTTKQSPSRKIQFARGALNDLQFSPDESDIQPPLST
jgi:hypothetical protein